MAWATLLGQVPTAWLDGLLAMSWQVGLLALVVLGISLLAGKASPRFRYALWCLVLAKLCLPPAFTLPTGIGRWLPDMPAAALTTPEPLPAPVRTAVAEPGSLTTPGLSPTVRAQDLVPEVAPTPRLPSWAHSAVPWARVAPALVWLAGVLAMAGLLARSYRHMRRQVRSGVPVTDPQVLAVLREAQDILHVRTPVPLLAAEGIRSPVLVGLFRPRILLPARVLTASGPAELMPVFLHELAHLRRGDLWVSWLQVVAQTLYWFHPFVWLANLRLRAERELIVDDEVLAHLDGKREVYGESLLRVVRQAVRRQWLAPAYIGIAEPRARIAFRLQRILDPNRKLSLRLGWPARAAVAALALVLIPQARTGGDSDPQGTVDGRMPVPRARTGDDSGSPGIEDGVAVPMALGWGSGLRADIRPVYQENFNGPKAPAWTTNNSSYYHWDPTQGTYAATQVNVPWGGYYSCHDVGTLVPGFVLEWDVILHRVDYAGGLHFGVLEDPDLDTESASRALVVFTRGDQGLFIRLDYIDANGLVSVHNRTEDQFSLNTWYHVRMEYDALEGRLSAGVTTAAGAPLSSLLLNGLAPFGSVVGFIGSANVRAGTFQVPGATTVAELDNVSFSIVP